MKLHLFRNDDLTELVFQNRNKEYGAYALRTGYHRTLNRSMAITLSAFGLFAGTLILWPRAERIQAPTDPLTVEAHVLERIDVEQHELRTVTPPAARVTDAPPAARTDAGFAVVEHVEPERVVEAAVNENTAGSSDNAGSSEGTAEGDVAVGASSGLETISAGRPMESVAVDQAPVFPGGMENFYKYLRKRITMTDEALRAGLSGRLYLDFVVGSDGRVTGVHMLKGVGYGMDEQVARILAQSPSWAPGVYEGQAVATILRLPVFLNTIQ